jgi:hypothetical protein
MTPVSLAVRTARLVYSCVFSTMMLDGTFSTTGAKFQMARTPPATIRSVTAWAASAGTAMMPIRTPMRRARFSSLPTGRTRTP